MKTTPEINEADVHSAYLDSDGSLFLYDKDGNDIEGWPKGWPEHIVSVREFLEARQIHYVNKPARTLAEQLGIEEPKLEPASVVVVPREVFGSGLL